MAKIKRRHEQELVAKAERVFSQQARILTGHGLSRRELRKLERLGIVKKRLVRTNAGSLTWLWNRVCMPRIAARIHSEPY